MSKVVIRKRKDAEGNMIHFKNYDVLIDGKNLKDILNGGAGVFRLELDLSACQTPVLKIEMHPKEIEFEGDAKIIKAKQGDK
ncbi:hypothetical protein [Bacillus swezeyi]|uniref:hypothetical protein n=1 Tax=Bacillus swezeyi TaxID=1925020 RepID=UPI0027DC8FD7|nr:hypothetical protein [Bacillus swezeyi]